MDKTPQRWPALLIFGVLAASVIALSVVPHFVWGSGQIPSWIGQNHELANVIFAALAFAGVIYTILLQSDELRLQRQELEETRAELKRTADAQQKSEQALLLSAYLSAQNSMFLANLHEEAGEQERTFQPARGRNTWMLSGLHTFSKLLKDSLPYGIAGITSCSAAKHYLESYSQAFKQFLYVKEHERDCAAIYHSIGEVEKDLSKLRDMLNPQDDHFADTSKGLGDLIEKCRDLPVVPQGSRGVSDFSGQAFQQQISQKANYIAGLLHTFSISGPR